MRVEVLDSRSELLRLYVESIDDLWLLYTTIREGDYVRMKTLREVKQREGKSSRRLPMTLTIKVKKLEFQPFTNKLRIMGVIVEGPERFGLVGSHHTFSVGVGDELIVYREGGWGRSVLRRLIESGRLRKPVVIVAVDYDEVGIGVLYRQGLRILFEKTIEKPGKDVEWSSALDSEIKNLAKTIKEIVDRENASSIVIGGPGFMKNRLANAISSISGSVRIVIDNASIGGEAGVKELVRRGTPAREAEAEELAEAEKILENAMLELTRSPGEVAVGIDECVKAAELKAIKELLVLDEMLYTIDSNLRSKVEQVIKKAEDSSARIIIIPLKTPVGERLLGLGGILARLYYSITGVKE